MSISDHDEGLLRRFLLSALQGRELEHVRRELLTRPGAGEELLCIEDEVIDQYIGGELTGDELKGFEENFLQDAGRAEKLWFGKLFRKYLEKINDGP